MTGFVTIDNAITVAGLNGKLQRLNFSKLMTGVAIVNIPYSLWASTGVPAAGTSTATGVANGRACNKATVGSLDYLNDAFTGEQSYLALFGAGSAVTGTLIVCDRLADCNLGANEATAAITGLDGTARLGATTAPGDGGQLWCEATAAISAGNTFTYGFTDNLGNSVTTGNMTTSIVVVAQRSVNSQLWQTLGTGTGTTGVRAITQNTLAAPSGATGSFNACIVRPLATISIPTASQYVERDLICEIPAAPRIWDNACLFMIWVPTAVTATTLFGELRVIAG